MTHDFWSFFVLIFCHVHLFVCSFVCSCVRQSICSYYLIGKACLSAPQYDLLFAPREVWLGVGVGGWI